MGPDSINKCASALLIVILLFSGSAVTAPLQHRPDNVPAEMELPFDPDLLKQHVSRTDDYGERPLPPPLPPDTENLYKPNLENEYY